MENKFAKIEILQNHINATIVDVTEPKLVKYQNNGKEVDDRSMTLTLQTSDSRLTPGRGYLQSILEAAHPGMFGYIEECSATEDYYKKADSDRTIKDVSIAEVTTSVPFKTMLNKADRDALPPADLKAGKIWRMSNGEPILANTRTIVVFNSTESVSKAVNRVLRRMQRDGAFVKLVEVDSNNELVLHDDTAADSGSLK